MKYFSAYVSFGAFIFLFYLFYLQSHGQAEPISVILCFAIAISFAIAEHLKTVEKKIIHSNAMVIGAVSAIVLNRSFHATSGEEQVIRMISGVTLFSSIIWIIGEWGDVDPNEAIREKRIRDRVKRKFRLLKHLKSRSL